MSIPQLRRLRTDSALPRALHEALRELPNGAPEPAQLDELRLRLGIAAPIVEAPVHPLLVSDRELKQRRLRRTVVVLVFFPIAATAAVGAVVDLHQRSVLSSAAALNSSAAIARGYAQQVDVRASPRQTPGPTIAPAIALEALASPTPSASTASAARVPGSARSSALASSHSEPGPRETNPEHSASAATEVDLLQRANAALKGDPALALAFAGQHRQLFAAGNLSQEREVIAIKALVALGDSARARDGLKRFQLDYPRSAHALELRDIVH